MLKQVNVLVIVLKKVAARRKKKINAFKKNPLTFKTLYFR